MSVQIPSAHGLKYVFFAITLIVMTFALGVFIYASKKVTEARSRAANEVVCTLPTKEADGNLVCKPGYSIDGDTSLCCPCSPRPPCPDGSYSCDEPQFLPGSAPFCPVPADVIAPPEPTSGE
jgi:hypothetical protein